MDDKEIIDNELVDKFDAEDTIFNNCMNDFSEFPSYISHYDDFVGPYSTKFMSPDFKNLNLDSVMQRKNNNLCNFEHHSRITSSILRRDYNYVTTLHNASKEIVEPFIFNTDKIPLMQVDYANQTMFYNPKFFNTRQELGIVNLNNLRYKVLFKLEFNQYDGLDLIWLIKSDIDINTEDLLLELTEGIWAKAVAPKWMLNAIRKNLLIWAKKYLTDPEKIKTFKKAIKMSKIEIKSFEEEMRIAGIAGELERAEERGIKIGLDEGHKNGFEEGLDEGHKNGFEEGLDEGRETTEELFISKLLDDYTPEEISKKYEMPLQRVLEIKNKNDQI